jgi:hypothetical protein
LNGEGKLSWKIDKENVVFDLTTTFLDWVGIGFGVGVFINRVSIDD